MANKVDLGFAFNLPPEDAIKYFESKGYTIGFRWQDVWQEAHARSFTVAGILKQDILEDVRLSLGKAMTEGQSYQQWVNELQPTLEKKGWMGKGLIIDTDTGEISGKRLAPRRLETIWQTNMQSSMAAGRYQRMMENVDNRPWWRYVAILDNRTRPNHAAQHDAVYRYDDAFWFYFYPPNGWGCRCMVVTLSDAAMKRAGLEPSSSEGLLVEYDQVINKDGDTRKAMALKNPITGKLFKTDAGFNYNVGQSYLASLGQLHLDQAIHLSPQLASVATGALLKNPTVQKALNAEVSKLAQFVVTAQKTADQARVIGAIGVNALTRLVSRGAEPASAIVELPEETILNAIKSGLSPSLYNDLVSQFLRPTAVYMKPRALLYIFDEPDGYRVMTVKMGLPNRITKDELVSVLDLKGWEKL